MNFKAFNKTIIALAVVFAPTLNAQDGQVTNTIPDSNSPKLRKFGVSIEPIWLAIKGIGLGIDYNMSSNLSLGINSLLMPSSDRTEYDEYSAYYDESFGYKNSRYDVGLFVKYMITGSNERRGLYIKPEIGRTSVKITEYSSSNLSGSLDTSYLRATIGYQWQVKMLRFAVGGGVFSTLGDGDVIIKDTNGATVLKSDIGGIGSLALDAQVGFAF